MPNEETYFDEILSTVSTREEASLLQDEVDALMASLYQTDPEAFDRTLDGFVRAKPARLIKKALAAGEERKSFLLRLKEKLFALQSLHLSLAFYPTQEVLTNLHAWTERNLGRGVFLETEIDPSLLGGAVVSFRGKYLDNSLASRLDEYFSKGGGKNA